MNDLGEAVVEDGRFSGIFTYKDFDLMFEGRFSKDRQSIDLEVEMIGTLTLHSETDESA